MNRSHQNPAVVLSVILGVLITGAPAPAAAAAKADIDAACSAIQQSVGGQTPVHVAQQNGKWSVVTDSGFAAAQASNSTTALADAYSQGNYLWVQGRSAGGAFQLCYRADGSLQRAKQSATLPGLGAVDAAVGYFAADGTLLDSTGGFDAAGGMVAKKLTDLPFYALLP
ncbi:MAG: hypothetical protein ACLQPV_07055 [Vulcanimicrobiaceae bacterium]